MNKQITKIINEKIYLLTTFQSSILFHYDLTDKEKIIYLALCSSSNEGQQCEITQKEVAMILNEDERVVKEAINALEEKKLIETTPEGNTIYIT
jgi:predicted transcriptional regulator